MTLEEIEKRKKPMFGYAYRYISTYRVKNGPQYVTFSCEKHGKQTQRLDCHLKNGCKWCKIMDSNRRNYPLAYGVGVNDVADVWRKHRKAFSVWRSMLSRCYDEKHREKAPTYEDCTVCEEWLVLSSFIKWFDKNYIEGYHLDKDIIKKGNKVYCPEYCAFVPREINSLLLRRQKMRGNYVIGVKYDKYKDKMMASVNKNGKQIFCGYFDNELEAFNAYCNKKYEIINEVAEKYKGKVDVRIYNALKNYKIEITD